MWNRRYIIRAMLRAYVKGEITREELQFTNEKQEEEVKNLEKKLLQAEKDYRSFLRQKKEKKQFVNALLSVKEKSVLTPELIRMLISKIILTPERCMEIKYRFGHTKAGYTDVFQYPRRTKWNEGGRNDD
ncbi:unknown [Firmicutes bacterium CAG:95]|nr:unknown [Firmicutes bacterium CAG:95]